ncbi:E3 ubiquitin-protein ligase TRIM71 isoform X2 [Anthonomus grandis grandis]|uniref:E3 ubiquitin-protein ligase TRIM71 isoform X2 n=1 Tax=Anthonomus grandis grandis TaxID=2921223 RepID=UPI002165B6D2|nr:E3 ubiquitin-protein ligase TRIM71 isoform X2 [Anthonomus grandis grandis]
MVFSPSSSIPNTNPLTAQAHGDAGANQHLSLHKISDNQIEELVSGSETPLDQCNLPSSRLPNSQSEVHPKNSQQSLPIDNNQLKCYELFGDSFFKGFFVDCSICHQMDKASAKCYECNTFMCEKYRLSPTVISDSEPSTSRESNNDSVPTSNQSDHSSITNYALSRVVGAGRRSNGESSRDSSRTSSINLPSPTESRRSSDESIVSIQTTLSSISVSININSNNGIFNASSPQSYYSEVLTPRSSLSPPSAKSANQHSLSSPSVNQQKRADSLATNGEEDFNAKEEEGQLISPSNIVFPFRFEWGICDLHKCEFVFFCNECMIPVCSMCITNMHDEHPLIYITEAVQKVAQMSHDINGQIKQVNVILRQSLDNLQGMSDYINFRAHEVTSKVKHSVKRIITDIERRQDEILQSLEQAKQVKQTLINFQMENIRLCYSRLARASDLMNDPVTHFNAFRKMAANYQAYNEVIQARNLGIQIGPRDDIGFMFTEPTNIHIHSIYLGQLIVSSSPITNMLCKQPLLYIDCTVSAPKPSLITKSRPIYGCRDTVTIKDFGRMPKLVWGENGVLPGYLSRPWGLAINRFGQMIVADRSNDRVQVFDCEGKYLFHFGSQGSQIGQFDRPSSVAVSPINDNIIVVDKDNHRIQVFNMYGDFLFTFGEKGSRIGQFMYPWDVACDGEGNILVSDARNHRLQMFRWDGIFITKWGIERITEIMDTPRGVTFDPMGNIIMTDFNKHRVILIDRYTNNMRFIGKEGKERGQFNRPQGVVCDDRGWFVVTDSRNYRFQVFNEKGEFMWMVGRQGKKEPAEFDRPCAAALDPEGHIHLMDFGNDRIQVF